MKSGEEIRKEISAALERDPRISRQGFPIQVEYRDGEVVLTGELEFLSAKKMALEVTGSVKGVAAIIDRLRVQPAEAMTDGQIRDHVCNALLSEQLLEPYAIRARIKGAVESVREPLAPFGAIEIDVNNGVVTLDGQIGSLSQKRIAGVLAWWVPGSADVINGLEVSPPEEDNDDEVVDAVRLTLEKDPFINASQIRVTCSNYVVTLEGLVTNETERRMAETDSWYIFRVNNVINLLQTRE